MAIALDRIVTVSLLVGSLALTVATAPRVVAHLMMSAGEPHMELVRQGKPLPPARMRAAIESRAAALRWADIPEAWVELGRLHLARAADRELSPRAVNAMLDQSIYTFRRGLALSPHRPYAWLQFLQAAIARGLPEAEVNRLFNLSIDLAALETRLVKHRVRLGFYARTILSPPVAGRIAEQVRLMARNEPHPLAEFARARFALAWVRAALRSDPELLARFDAAYLRLPPA